MKDENYYLKIIEFYQKHGIEDSEKIAIDILKNTIPTDLLDYAFEMMSNEEARAYLNSLEENWSKNNINNLVEEYDNIRKQEDVYWEKLKDIKPKNMTEPEFHATIQEIRYTKRLTEELIDNFDKGKIIECKQLIFRGADKQKLYKYAEKVGGKNLTMIQAWLLEDLHNIRNEKHFPYMYDKEISDYKIISSDQFLNLLKKFENKEEFSKDELDKFIIAHDDNMYTAIDNTYGFLFTEDFKDKILAIRYLNGEEIDRLRDEECRYEIGIYETKEDYEHGEPFQHDVLSDLKEAKNILNNLMKLNNYYSGFVLDQKTGIEEYAYYNDKQLEDEESEEDEI